ncbi:SHOCT domain-containing protein [Haloarcula sp. JP-L23]|uniref:SHOCT domain-containing protein n=1 Tax=Haloarcula sp. JP-L23 TaxID=2716717 RepID=UPI00140F2F05|nr:SHOCT domain-containing protein [Haloarcula sp. JP-L23]
MHTTHDTTPLAGALSLGILAVGLGGLALGVPWAWVAFPVGYGGVLPLALGLAKRRREPETLADDAGDDALATLRERYATGEIDEREFEARVEGLLETER